MKIASGFAAFILLIGSFSPLTTDAHPRHYYEEKGTAIWEVPTETKWVAVTFDDGPSGTYTPEIMEVLKKHGAKGTFFVVGSRAQKHPDLIREMVEEGHEIANHTYHHPSFTGISKQEIVKEIGFTAEVIKEITGEPPTLFRPPGGVYNDIIVDTASEEGYMVVMWSWHQDTKDWQSPGVNRIVDTVLQHSKNGDIILFHDFGGNRSQTVQALNRILPVLKEDGFQFVTVSELIEKHPKYKIIDDFSG
ncbi:polysaccharide deacetylase family protein [Halobacillus halophilus]|uniref:polysaccharide deacetylase family protein n=1 Tax=Halobacillus halophilus TaxID=1570 RepID=UPI001F43B242|nr:polysaccharide deacetylase family protein [Halobacillus halophilus]